MKRVLSFLLTLVLVGAMLSAALPTLAKESTGPKAPISLVYRLDQVGGGMADGVVSVTLPKGHKADAVYLYWADDEGKLEGFSSLTPIKVSGNVVNHRMVAGSFIPFGATRLLAYTYSVGLGFSSECASFRLPQGAAVSEEALGELFMEFQSVSDIHVTAENTGREHTRDNFRIMLEDIVKVSPGSVGVISNGDNVNGATDADYTTFAEIYDAVKDAPDLFLAFGNHELFRYGTPVPSGQFSTMKSAYVKFMDRFTPADAAFSAGDRFSSLSFTFEKNGYKFIFLGTDVCDQNNQSLNANTLAWLEAELQESADRKIENPLETIFNRNKYQGQISPNEIVNKIGDILNTPSSKVSNDPFGLEFRYAVIIIKHMPDTLSKTQQFEALFSGQLHQAKWDIIYWGDIEKYDDIISYLEVVPFMIIDQ